MKTNKALKIPVLILALSLLVGMLFCVNTLATDETKPEIISQNVKYSEKFCLMYAVDAETVEAGPVKLYLYEQSPDTGAGYVKVYEASEITPAAGNLNKDCYIFTTDGVTAYAMAQNFYVQAVDAKGNASDVKRYSVGEYLYERLASSDASVKQREFYNATLNFGAGAQKIVAKETDESKYINNYCYVTSIDGTLVDGYSGGIFPKGSTVTLSKSGATELTAISYDVDGGYVTKITDGAFTVPSNAVSVEVNEGRRVIYRESAQSFDSADTSYFKKQAGSVTMAIADNDINGKVYSATFTSTSKSQLRRESSYRDVTVAPMDTATALEISFDLRVTLDTSSNTTADPYFNLEQEWWYGSSNSRAYLTELHFKDGTLAIQSEGKSNTRVNYQDVELGEWFHVRVVTYKGDSNRYIYINGSDIPFVDSSNVNFTGSIKGLTNVDFAVRNQYGKGFTLEIDNYFYGYTMDKNPNAQ